MKEKKPQGRWNNEKAVTALLSTIMLLAIAISLVTLIYTAVLNSTTQNKDDHANVSDLVASVVQDHVTFMNCGGEVLGPDTQITVVINQNTYTFTVGDLNGDKSWAPGEELVYNSTYSSLIGLQVEYSILDKDANSVIIHGVIQEGEQGDTPYVQTVGASQISAHSARLTLNYNFITPHVNQQVRIQFKTDSVTSQYDPATPWATIVNSSTSGSYFIDVHDLLAGQRYVFRSQLLYQGIAIPKQGLGLTFTTPSDRIGEWNFDSSSGLVLDSRNNNHGALQPDDRRGPRYGPGMISNALRFDGIDDKVNIPDSNSLDVVDEMTFETWIKPQNNSNGSAASFTQLSSSQFFDTTYGCFEPDWISLGGEYYAIVSRAYNGYGFLSTVRITDGGTIFSNATTCLINTVQISTSCLTPKIIAVDSVPGVYAIVYTSSNYGYLRTVSISDTGIIGSFLKTFGFSTTRYCYHPDIVFVGGSTYAIVFGTSTTATSSYGYIQCVSITGGGATVALKGAVFPMTHDGTPAYLAGQQVLVQEPEILELEEGSWNNYFVIVYKCRDDDGGVYTVQINPSTGAIIRLTGERKFDSKRGENPEIFYITGKFYGVVYGCEGSSSPYNDDLNHLKGFVTIIRISEFFGTIYCSGEEANRYVPGGAYAFRDREYGPTFSSYTFRAPHVVFIKESFGRYTYAFSYTLRSTSGSTMTRGYVRTLKIQPQTPFSTFSELSNFSYDANIPENPDIIRIGGSTTTYGLVNRIGTASNNNNGMLKTLTIFNNGTIPSKPILDSKILGVSYAPRIDLLRLSNNRAVSVVQGMNNSLFLKTFYVPASGVLPLYYNDSLALELGVWMGPDPYQAGYEPSLFPLSGNYYSVVYRNYSSKLTFAVVQIDAFGHITSAWKRSINGISLTTNSQPVACAVDAFMDVYLVAYRDSGGRGKLLTIRLTSTGSMMLTNASLDASVCSEPFVYKVGGGYYAVAYCGVGSKGELKTFQVSGGGSTITFVDEYIFADTTRWCAHPGMTQVNQSIFAVTYSRRELTGRYSSVVFTVDIRANGTIQKSNIDNMTFNFASAVGSQSSAVTNPSIQKMGGRLYLLTYKNNILGCGLASIRIGDTGNISDAIDYTLLTSSVDSYHLSLVPLAGSQYLVGTGSGLMVRSIRVSWTPVARIVFSKAGSYELYANATSVTAKVYDTGTHTLTCALSYVNDWNYVVVTYKAGRYMNLTVNANDSGSNGKFVYMADTVTNHLFAIKVTTTPLYFGEYNAWFDEFSMWGSAFSSSWIHTRFHNPNA